MVSKTNLWRWLAVTGLLWAALLSAAEEAVTPVREQSFRGWSMAQAESHFGSPLERSPAVGTPPIVRWRYADFTLYFELDRLLHKVKHRPSAAP